MRLVGLSLLLWILPGRAVPHPTRPFIHDEFTMHLAATVPYFGDDRFVAGDADRDGEPELYLYSGWDSTFAVEHVGDFEFEATYLGFVSHVWDIGDCDGDGLTDLVAQRGIRLQVHESPDSFSFPRSTVLVDSMNPFLMYARICDLDGDSTPDFVCDPTKAPPSVALYESVADDSYQLKCSIRAPRPIARPVLDIAVTCDLDRDGRQEIVVGHEDWAAFYEGVANDTFACIAACSLFDGGKVGAAAAARDMDRDGRQEAFVCGGDFRGQALIAMFESPSNDSFEIVWEHRMSGGLHDWCMSVGDIDGDSVPELAVSGGGLIRVFKCVGNDSFIQVWDVETSHRPVLLYDLNGDGLCELIMGIHWATAIYAYGDSVGIVQGGMRAVGRIRISPSVTRGTPVRVAGIADGTEVEVVDAAGRIVARPRDGFWNPRGVSPGAYFVRVRAGGQAVVQKVLVLR